MDAAERVFARRRPDDAGLVAVADEAGVSHALITHYFGTYAGLVRSTLERRLRTLREKVLARLVEATVQQRAEELLAILFDTLDDPVHLRLLRWLLANEGADSTALGLQEQGLKMVANGLAAALFAVPTPAQVARLEVMLVTAVSAAYGYATGKQALAGAVGRKASRELDLEVRQVLARMVQAYLVDFREGSAASGH